MPSFKEGDTVMICWSNELREDYLMSTEHNVHYYETIPQSTETLWGADRLVHSINQSFVFKRSVIEILQNKKINFVFLGMVPSLALELENDDDFKVREEMKNLREEYSYEIAITKKSFGEVLPYIDYGLIVNDKKDRHPLPTDYLEYLQIVMGYEPTTEVKEWVEEEKEESSKIIRKYKK
jgi:hypothetical protein